MKPGELDDKHIRRIKYIKAVIFWLIAFIACLIIEDPFSKTEAVEVIWRLCNSFTVPGIIFAGIAGLSYISYLGGYDSLGYVFSNFGLHNIFTTRQPTKYKDLYEYKQMKEMKGRRWLPHFLVIGLISLAVGVVLLFVYFIIC